MENPNLRHYRETIITALGEHATHLPTRSSAEARVMLDFQNDVYTLMLIGWRRMAGVDCVVAQVTITDGKVWVKQDSTQPGIGYDLARLGIPPEDIVLDCYRVTPQMVLASG
jgi:hypothetical protein